MEEKRQLLNFVLQNLELKERKLMFKTKTPFDTVLVANKCSNVGGIVEDIRTKFMNLALNKGLCIPDLR